MTNAEAYLEAEHGSRSKAGKTSKMLTSIPLG